MFDKTKTKNYYEILEVPFNANNQTIKDGYVRAKNAYSGDNAALYTLLTKEECDEILEQIETAFSVLSIPEKRKKYDHAKGIKLQNGHENGQSNYSNMNGFSDKGQNLSSEMSQDFFKINKNEVEISVISARKRFELKYNKNPEFEQKIENTTTFTGEFLKEIREYKNVSIKRLSDLTKISKTYLRYIEEEQMDLLPARAYVRGFVYQYAKTLKLNPDLVATSYINQIKKKDPK